MTTKTAATETTAMETMTTKTTTTKTTTTTFAIAGKLWFVLSASQSGELANYLLVLLACSLTLSKSTFGLCATATAILPYMLQKLFRTAQLSLPLSFDDNCLGLTSASSV